MSRAETRRQAKALAKADQYAKSGFRDTARPDPRSWRLTHRRRWQRHLNRYELEPISIYMPHVGAKQRFKKRWREQGLKAA